MKLITEKDKHYLVETVEVRTETSREALEEEINALNDCVKELLNAIKEKEEILSQMK